VIAVNNDDNAATAGPALSPQQLEELARQAGDTVWEQAPGMGLNLPVTAETAAAEHNISHFGSSPNQYLKGTEYGLAAACAGRGKVTVRWQAPGEVTGELPVVCGNGRVTEARFTPQANGLVVKLNLIPDSQATDRAGIGVYAVDFS
jgi:hypothetical protein